MDKVTIREATKDDYEIINSFAKELFEYHKKLMPQMICEAYRDYDVENFENEVVDDDKIWLVAEVDGQAVGEGFAYISANRFNQIYAYIESIYVMPQYRKLGIATKLMANVEEFAKENDVSSIQLNVWAPNVAAFEFYKKLGLEPCRFKMEKKI